jgi:nitroreductase
MLDVIKNRRSVRKYSGQPVEPEKLNSLLRAAMQAPSAVNQQPWEFLVVTDRQTLIKLADMSLFSKMVAQAGVVIIVLGNQNRLLKDYFQQDLAAATQNILLEAVNQGLGAVWLGGYPNKDRMKFLTKLFKLPFYIVPFSVISIGYPLSDENQFVDRYDEKRVHYEQY